MSPSNQLDKTIVISCLTVTYSSLSRADITTVGRCVRHFEKFVLLFCVPLSLYFLTTWFSLHTYNQTAQMRKV